MPRKGAKMVMVTIYFPPELLQRLESLRKRGIIGSVSEFVRNAALEKLLEVEKLLAGDEGECHSS